MANKDNSIRNSLVGKYISATFPKFIRTLIPLVIVVAITSWIINWRVEARKNNEFALRWIESNKHQTERLQNSDASDSVLEKIFSFDLSEVFENAFKLTKDSKELEFVEEKLSEIVEGK